MCQSVPPFPFSEPEYTFCSGLLPVDTHSPPGEPVSRMKLYCPSPSHERSQLIPSQGQNDGRKPRNRSNAPKCLSRAAPTRFSSLR